MQGLSDNNYTSTFIPHTLIPSRLHIDGIHASMVPANAAAAMAAVANLVELAGLPSPAASRQIAFPPSGSFTPGTHEITVQKFTLEGTPNELSGAGTLVWLMLG